MNLMKNNLYQVDLVGYFNEVWAMSEEEAVILAQAEAIRHAKDYKLISVTKVR
jgi:hypothetical protein